MLLTIIINIYYERLVSQVELVVKNPLVNAGDARDVCLIPRLGRSLGRGHGNPLQYSYLENPHGCSLPGSSVHGILRQEYWSGLPCPLPRDLPNLGIKSMSLNVSCIGRQVLYH